MAVDGRRGLNNLKCKVNPQEAIKKHVKEQEEAYKEREEAIKKVTTVIEKLKQEGKEITEKNIVDYLFDHDYRDYEKYNLWIKILCRDRQIPEVEEENCK